MTASTSRIASTAISQADSAPTRAGIFIGVEHCQGLPRLHDACAGARNMHKWALAQGIADVARARLITDKGNHKVTFDEIFDAVNEIVRSASVDQLIVYFAGHGVLINRNEHWLLSDAPERANAAVNVSGSVDLARYCGIRHVVFISDACRTAAQDVQTQAVRGLEIFPNLLGVDRARPVDQFFACLLGRPAAELINPEESAVGYRAIYTSALLDGLLGDVPQILQASGDPTDPRLYVYPSPLSSYLEEEVPRRIRKAGLHYRYSQEPEALIMVNGSWMSRIGHSPQQSYPGPLSELPQKPPEPPQVLRGSTPAAIIDSALPRITEPLLGGRLDTAGTLTPAAAQAYQPPASALVREVLKADRVPEHMERAVFDVMTPFGPRDVPTGCGVKVRGADIADCSAGSMSSRQLSTTVAEIELDGRAAGTAAVQFADGAGTLLPVFDGYMTALTFRDGELADVGFEPVPGRYSGDDAARAARALLAAGAQEGRLALGEASTRLLTRMCESDLGTSDPAFLLYAAWALHDRQTEEQVVARQAAAMAELLGAALFDLVLLGWPGRERAPALRTVPFTPLLGRGWALLRARGYILPPEADGIEETMLDSTWALYSAVGFDQLRKLASAQEER